MVAAERDDAPVTALKNIEPERELFAEAVTIARPPGELYAFWRDLTNVAPFMGAMVSIIPLDGTRARWTLKGSTGVYASWITLITEERPGATIFWQTEPGGDVDHGGRIDFLDAGARGSILRITLAFAVSKELHEKGMFKQLASADPGAAVRAHVRRTLRSLKQMMEAREIATPFRHRRLMNVLSWQSEDKWKEKTMTDLGAIKEHMDIVGADGVHLGTVDRVEGHRIKLTLSDSGSHAGSEGAASAQKGGGHHHYISVGLVAAVEDGRVRLSADARNAALLEEEENGEALADFNRTASADDETGDEVAGDNAGDGKV